MNKIAEAYIKIFQSKHYFLYLMGFVLAGVFIFLSAFYFWQNKTHVIAQKELPIETREERTDYLDGTVKGATTGVQKDLFVDDSIFPLSYLKPVKKPEKSDLVLPNAHASIILDVDSGSILHYNNGRERRQIASLVKILTATLVVENVEDLQKEVVISDKVLYIEGTRIGCPRTGYCISNRLQVGEKMTVYNLLRAMLMNSANDAATLLAHEVGGSVEGFSDMMNAKVEELGLKDSHFCTPSGLEISEREHECYSTAYDIARIASYALKHDIIWEILRTPGPFTIYSTDGIYSHTILNTDVILDKVPNLIGGKTGFTPLAGRSLLMAAYDESHRYRVVGVVLNDPYRWQDMPQMLEWAFDTYEWK